MSIQILTGDVRDILPTIPAKSVQCVVTSPPYYGLRNYGVDGQIGLESTLTEYIETMVDVFRFVRETLADDGVMWLNIGDSYATDTKGSGGQTVKQITNAGAFYESRKFNHGLKPKDLMMVPARLALALQVDGWYLRSDIIWHKPNPMPESVQDRPTSAHEHIFLLTKSSRYYYDADAIREPLALSSVARLAQDVDAQIGSDRANGGAKTNGTMKAVSRLTGGPRLNPDRRPSKGIEGCTDKQHGHSRRHAGFNDRWDAMARDDQMALGANSRNVWTIATVGFPGAHFATFPPEIPRRCILAGSRESDTILDPFAGAGTTLLVADRLGRNAIGIELNPAYVSMAEKRIYNDAPLLATALPTHPTAAADRTEGRGRG